MNSSGSLYLIIALIVSLGGWFTRATAQELVGKSFSAHTGSTCKLMTDGGCSIDYYRVLEFSEDSVRVSYRVEASCTPVEREAAYERLHDNRAKSYKWTVSNGIVLLEGCTEFKPFKMDAGNLVGTLIVSGESQELLFREEQD